MAFEIIYKYYKEVKRGEYNKEEEFEGSLPVGDPYEKVSLDVLASKIMSLLAKRSIHIFNIEIFEIVKKKIDFEEVEDGIRIKDKKYSFDDMPSSSTPSAVKPQEGLAETLAKLLASPEFLNSIQKTGLAVKQEAEPSKTKADGIKVDNVPLAPRRSPLRYETYQPHPDAPKNTKFTVGKKYPIFLEKISKNPSLEINDPRAAPYYETTDDMGNPQIMNSMLFSTEVKVDDGMKGKNPQAIVKKEVDLWGSVGGVEGGPAPSLRKR